MSNARYYGRGNVALTSFTEPPAWVVTDTAGVELARIGLYDGDGQRDTYADALSVLGLKRRHGLNLAIAVIREWTPRFARQVESDVPPILTPALAGRAATVVLEVRRRRNPLYVPRELSGADAYLLERLTDLHDAGRITRGDLLNAARVLTRYQTALDLVTLNRVAS